MIFLLKVRVLRVNLGRGKVKVVQVNRALVSWYYMAMNMESNRSLCRVNRGFELTGFASAVFFSDKKTMHNFSNESKNRIFYCNAVSCNERTVDIFSSKRKIMNFTFSIYFSWETSFCPWKLIKNKMFSGFEKEANLSA